LNHPITTELQALKRVAWSDDYEGPITGLNIILWAALDELAATTELFIAIEDLEEAAPRTVQVLEGGREHFAALATPRPYPLELLLLKLERHKAGLDPEAQ
jgi:hypothetical protein